MSSIVTIPFYRSAHDVAAEGPEKSISAPPAANLSTEPTNVSAIIAPFQHSAAPRNPKTYQFDIPSGMQPKQPLDFKEKIHTQAFNAATAFSPIRMAPIRGIVIHATAGSSTEGAVSVILDRKASWHFTVPDENEAAHGDHVWATTSEGRIGYHVRNGKSHPDFLDGHSRVNDVTLGIEIVNRQDGIDTFSNWQVKATGDIILAMIEKHGTIESIVGHAKLDPTRRTDPGAGFPWERLEQYVIERLEPATPKPVEEMLIAQTDPHELIPAAA